MELEFKKQYDPELDVCNLLHFYFSSTPPVSPVSAALDQLSSERGISADELRSIAAPALEMEEYILSNLDVPEERLRYFFPPSEQQDGAVALPLCWFRKLGVRFSTLSGEELVLWRCWLLRNISNVPVEELLDAGDISRLFEVLRRHNCTDHTIRICMDIFLEPAVYQDEFEEILRRAASLYREKLHILPDASGCTFNAFFRKWQEYADTLRTLDPGITSESGIEAYPTPFLFMCREAVLLYLPNGGSGVKILSGIWDDRITELIDQSEVKVAAMAMELKAISDRRRLELLGAIGEGEQTVETLCGRFSMSPALLSYHLEQLYRVNLITIERSGRTNQYHLNKSYLRTMLDDLNQYLRLPSPEDRLF